MSKGGGQDPEAPEPLEAKAAPASPFGKLPMRKPPASAPMPDEEAEMPPDEEAAPPEAEAPGYGNEAQGAKLISDIEAAGDAHGMSPEQSRSFAASIFNSMAECLGGGGGDDSGGGYGGDEIA